METQTDFETALAAYVETLNREDAARAFREYPQNAALIQRTFSTEVGPKFVRIVSDSGPGGRSAHAFVERATGAIWKPAGWKGPAKNFSRGSIYKLPQGELVLHVGRR